MVTRVEGYALASPNQLSSVINRAQFRASACCYLTHFFPGSVTKLSHWANCLLPVLRAHLERHGDGLGDWEALL